MTQGDDHVIKWHNSSIRRRRAFTLVEVLVVIAIIILLLSILVIGLNTATKTAQSANTRSLMHAISQGLVRFQDDVGYLPPILSEGRELRDPPEITAEVEEYFEDIQNWYSITTLAEYLLGYGNHRQDGYGWVEDQPVNFDWKDERPLLGIRHPRGDGIWGAGNRGLDYRMGGPNPPAENAPGRFDQGKVLGPYIEVDDSRLVGCIGDDGAIYFPGENGYAEPTADGLYAKVLCDYWGQPLQFFRRPYIPGVLGQSWRAGLDNNGDGNINEFDVPTLSRVVRLRPYGFLLGPIGPGGKEGPLPNVPAGYADRNEDPTTSFELEAAEFAMLSPGVDKVVDPGARMDEAGLNKDNIVEAGQ